MYVVYHYYCNVRYSIIIFFIFQQQQKFTQSFIAKYTIIIGIKLGHNLYSFLSGQINSLQEQKWNIVIFSFNPASDWLPLSLDKN